MKICFLAPADNYHTRKWCEFFVSKGHQVEVISFIDGHIDGVRVHNLNCSVSINKPVPQKIKYLFNVSEVKKIIREMNPDIINAHYASSYGMLAALAVPNCFILSTWGTDIYEFPKKSLVHKEYLKFVLKKAKYIFSTSNIMSSEINKYTSKNVFVTPFGVKMDLFNPNKKLAHPDFVVGTAKPLDERYGINYIIEAISIINEEYPEIDIKVKIAGKGPLEKKYRELATQKNVNIEWLGFISQEQVAVEFANMDIVLFPSNSESFSVSTIEAEASGTAVIVSNTPGLLETTIPNKTSIVVPQKNPIELANAIIDLYKDSQKRSQLGIEGRNYVLNKYEYFKCFNYIENLFLKLSSRNNLKER